MDVKLKNLMDKTWEILITPRYSYLLKNDINHKLSFIEELKEFEQSIGDLIAHIFTEFEDQDYIFKYSEYMQTSDGSNAIERKNATLKSIFKNIIYFLDIIQENTSFSVWNEHVPQLMTIQTLLGDDQSKKDLFYFFAKINDIKAFEYCKNHILSLIPEEKQKSNIYHGEFSNLTKKTPFLEESFDFLIEHTNELIDTINLDRNRQMLGVLVGNFRGYFINLIKRTPTLSVRLTHEFERSSSNLELVLIDVIKKSAGIPEETSKILEQLIDLLLKSSENLNLKTNILDMIQVTCTDNMKMDRGRVLSIIIDKSKLLGEDDAGPLSDLLDTLMLVSGEDAQKWRDAAQIIISKLKSDIHVAHQDQYIRKKLIEYGFTKSLTEFENANANYQINRQTALHSMRDTFEGLVTNLIDKIKSPSDNISSSFKDKLIFLEQKTLLEETPQNRGDQHLEVTHLYALYGLLSHYRTHFTSHPQPLPPDMEFILFHSTKLFIYMLLKRSEKFT